jgi:hypothetical protein
MDLALTMPTPIKNAYKVYGLMKKFLSRGSKKGDREKKPNFSGDDAKEKEDTFPEETGYLIIFGGPAVYNSKR